MSRALDKATKTWEVLEVLEPAVGAASINSSEIPAWVQMLRITGNVNHSNPTTDEPCFRLSLDGATFRAGASDYSYSYLFQSGVNLSGIAFTNTTLGRFMLLGNTVAQPLFEILMDVGGVRGVQGKYPFWQSRSTGIPGGSTLGCIIYSGYLNAAGPVKKIQFFCGGTSTFLPATKFILEGI